MPLSMIAIFMRGGKDDVSTLVQASTIIVRLSKGEFMDWSRRQFPGAGRTNSGRGSVNSVSGSADSMLAEPRPKGAILGQNRDAGVRNVVLEIPGLLPLERGGIVNFNFKTGAVDVELRAVARHAK